MDALMKKSRKKEKEKQRSKVAKERIEQQKGRMEKRATHILALRSIMLPSHPRDVPAAHAKYPPGPPCGLPPKSIFQEEEDEREVEGPRIGTELEVSRPPPPLLTIRQTFLFQGYTEDTISRAQVIEAAPQLRNFKEETTRLVPSSIALPRAKLRQRTRINLQQRLQDG